MPTPGEVYRISSKVLPTDDPKQSRRYVLMTPVGEERAYGSVAYASASEGALAKAPSVPVSPRPEGPDANGFEEHTLVFPGLLFPVTPPLVRVPLGALSPQELGEVFKMAPIGLGIGRGAARPAGLPTSEPGLRGIVTAFAEEIRARFPLLQHVVILTPYPYSVQAAEFQAVVPLYPGAKNVRAPDFVLPPTPWGDALGGNVCVAVSDVMMTKRSNLAPGPPNAACGPEEMDLIDAALLDWLGITRDGAITAGAAAPGPAAADAEPAAPAE